MLQNRIHFEYLLPFSNNINYIKFQSIGGMKVFVLTWLYFANLSDRQGAPVLICPCKGQQNKVISMLTMNQLVDTLNTPK